MPAVNDLNRLKYDTTGPLTRVILDHPSSKSLKLEEEDIWRKIEEYLSKNNILYAWIDPASAPYSGIIMWLPSPTVESTYPEKNDELALLSNLAAFLFDTLKLDRSCLHFIYEEIAITGDLKGHEAFEAVEEVVFEELTGQPLPQVAKALKLKDLKF